MDNIKKNNSKEFCDSFQEQVSDLLIRHKSILDSISKKDDYNSRINRAIAKSVTICGCISIHAEKQKYDGEEFGNLSKNLDSHLHGQLCDNCREVLESEIGNYLFYLTSVCNTLDLNLYDILIDEYERNKLLGVFSLK